MHKRSHSIANKVYKYVHREDVWIRTSLLGRNFENDWLKIAPDGKVTVKGSFGDGYAWDGCSPKWHFIDLLWGTPDGRLDYRTEEAITYYASMIHDAIYQFKKDENMTITRKEADILFKIILKEAGFMWSGLYYVAVRLGGRFYGRWHHENSERSVRIFESSWISVR